MRFTKLFTLALATAALAVPAATANDDPGKGHGKRDKPAKACKTVKVELKGSFVAAAADGKSFQMNAKKSNRHGRKYLKAAQPLTLNVDDRTRFHKARAKATLADLAANDRVQVLAKTCKRDLRNATSADQLPALTAKLVVAKTPKTKESPPSEQ
ncbi:MAG: hypothetical protein M3R70_06030 [Actinomycetota bacterium]|nr:hypothetical protein [Actinomycetota bacterium]